MEELTIHQNLDEVNSFMVRLGDRHGEWPAWWMDTHQDSFVPPASTTIPIEIELDAGAEDYLQKLYHLSTLIQSITADMEVTLAENYRQQIEDQIAQRRTMYGPNVRDILPLINSVLKTNERRAALPTNLVADDAFFTQVHQIISSDRHIEPKAKGLPMANLPSAPFGMGMANYVNMVSYSYIFINHSYRYTDLDIALQCIILQ